MAHDAITSDVIDAQDRPVDNGITSPQHIAWLHTYQRRHQESFMPAYAVAIISETCLNDEIRAYLEKIDSTLQPFAGQFIIHGGPYLSLEGEPTADLIVVKFPDLECASRWYESPAYQAIKPLRTANSVGTVFLVQGVPADHRAMDILA